MKQNSPIQMLMDEHEIISSLEDLIPMLDKQWEADKDNYMEKIKCLLEFFREYSDKFHHHKEEEILFKELIKNPDFLLRDIITELEEHHESFRNTVNEIEAALIKEDFEEVQSLLSQYISDLLDHIAVENEELFIMTESLFSADELERMYFLFEDIDRGLGLERKQKLAESIKKYRII